MINITFFHCQMRPKQKINVKNKQFKTYKPTNTNPDLSGQGHQVLFVNHFAVINIW